VIARGWQNEVVGIEQKDSVKWPDVRAGIVENKVDVPGRCDFVD
jgi:hypothetical protein